MRNLRRRLRLHLRKIDDTAAAVSFRARMTRPYYHVKGTFRREEKAVLAGRLRHARETREHSSVMFLRRSVHRLEKGIVAPLRRPVFGIEYLSELVQTYGVLAAEASPCMVQDLEWASSVLNKYFDMVPVGADVEVDRARARYAALRRGPDAALGPFQRADPAGAADFAALAALAAYRRSVRFFDGRVPARDIIVTATEVGLMAPSACNRQSLRVVIADHPPRAAALAGVALGTAGFFDQIPCLAVIVGQLRGYESERDRHAIYVDGGLFALGFILALEAQGVASCCINWPDVAAAEKDLRRVLPLAADERVVMLVAIGYAEPNQLVPRSHKRSSSSVLTWDSGSS